MSFIGLQSEHLLQIFWAFLGMCLELRGNCLDSEEIPSDSQQFVSADRIDCSVS